MCILLFAAGGEYITRSCVATNHTIGCFPLDELYGQKQGLQGVNPVDSGGMPDMSAPDDIDVPGVNVPGSIPWTSRAGRNMLFSGTGCLCAIDLCDPMTPMGWNESNPEGGPKGPEEIEHLRKSNSSGGAVHQIAVTHGFLVLGLLVLCAAAQRMRAQFH